MIEEAYVSFETSKLLKEKGFDVSVRYYYQKIDDDITYNIGDFRNWNVHDMWYSMPTLQMAMRWLREMHYLWIDIDPLTNYKWTWSIWFMNDPNLKMGESSQVITTYEEAVEAAIRYSLKNLI